MRIVILGASGQLGKELINTFKGEEDLKFFSRKELDITNYSQVRFMIEEYKPFVLVNAAAYTSVDKAESNIEESFKVNSKAVENIAKCLNEYGGYLIHYSTDYVFDGEKKSLYSEYDQTNPINVYGKSKLEGEKKIEENMKNFFIFRTSWVIGKYGKNFAKTIIALSKTKDSLNIVSDQIGVPTSTNLISRVTKNLMDDIRNLKPWPFGIYNVAPKGKTSWFEIAKTIVNYSKKKDSSIKIKISNINPILSKDYPGQAKRPTYSLLDTQKLQKNLKFLLPHWEDDLLSLLS